MKFVKFVVLNKKKYEKKKSTANESEYYEGHRSDGPGRVVGSVVVPVHGMSSSPFQWFPSNVNIWFLMIMSPDVLNKAVLPMGSVFSE